jgi:aspartate dehydrogenase
MAKDSELSVGIIGCGSIGTFVARRLDEGVEDLTLAGVCDVDYSIGKTLVRKLSTSVPVLPINQLISTCDIVVECASGKVAREVALMGVTAGKTVLIMSVGGLLNLSADEWGLIRQSKGKLIVPSGAIGGLDAIDAMSASGIEEVILTTRKSPASLDVKTDRDKVVFDGTARDAIAAFPKNVNVAVTLALATLGPDKVRVRVIADPYVSENVHEVHVKGEAADLHLRFQNRPFPDNPRTSYMAALSALSALRRIVSNVRIGG